MHDTEIFAGRRMFRPGDDLPIRLRFVNDNQADLPVTRMCELVEVPRSSFYAWAGHEPPAREVTAGTLLELIRGIHRRSRHTYGAPRVQCQLARVGTHVSRRRVARLMASDGLVGAYARKKWRRGRPDTGGAPEPAQPQFHRGAAERGVRLRM